jgi:hypothetical protein
MSGKRQKLVCVEGVGSFTMLGDELQDQAGDKAVATLLAQGWEIKSVNLISSPHGQHGCPTGYLIFEKP